MGSPHFPPLTARHLIRIATLLIPALLLVGCGMGGPQSTLLADGPVARSQLNLFYVTLAVTTFIFVTVGGVLAYAQWRFRSRPDDDDRDPPPQTHGHPLVETGLIVASTLLLVVIAVPTVRGIWFMEDTPDRENALEIRVTGYQWWFKFEYPGLGVVTANEMVIPTGRPVHLELRTMDVIHSFWVPKLAGKKDLIPNRANSMWLQSDVPGYFWAQCAEFCGESHANMKFRVVALDEPEFAAWTERQLAEARTAAGEAPAIAAALSAAASSNPTPAEPLALWRQMQATPAPATEDPALITRGRDLFGTMTCGGCHTVRGHETSTGMAFIGISGPDLTHFASRTTLAAAVLDNSPANLRAWLQHSDTIKPGNLMWRDGNIGRTIMISDDEADALVAYMFSLK